MANYSVLKSAIEAVIKTNGNNEITGALLQQSLISMITSLGAHYEFVDVATPSTNPGTPDQNVMYFAATAGTYTNFGGIVVNDGEFCALCWNGSWIKKTTGAATAEQVTELSRKVDDLGVKTVWTSFPDGTFIVSGMNHGQLIYNNKRVASNTMWQFLVGTKISANEGFRFGVHIFVNGAFSDDPGWQTEYNMPANTTFKIVIARQEPESEITSADIPTFVNAIHFDSAFSQINILQDGLTELSGKVNGNYTPGAYLDSTGTPVSSPQWGYSDFIPYIPGSDILWRWDDGLLGNTAPRLCLYDVNKTKIYDFGASVTSGYSGRLIPAASVPSRCAYIRCSFMLDTNSSIYFGDNLVWYPVNGTVRDIELQKYISVFPFIEKVQNAYIRFSDGTKMPSSNDWEIFILTVSGLSGKQVRVRAASGDNVPAAIAFYSNDNIVPDSYMHDDSVQHNISNRISVVEATIPSGAVTMVVSSRRNYGGLAAPSVFLKDSSVPSGIYLQSGSGVDLLSGTDLLSGATRTPQRYNEYITGKIVTSGATTPVEIYQVDISAYRMLFVEISNSDNVPAAIAFYSSSSPSESSYIKDWSVRYEVGRTSYCAFVPSNASVAVITNRYAALATPKIIGFKNFATPYNVAIPAINNPINNGVLYHHLNVEAPSASTTIPSQSLFDIRYAKMLGFNFIEANIQRCSDGVFVVKHGSSGTLGAGVKLIGGGDCSTVRFDEVTSSWLRENVVYDSLIEKYCVPIPTLDEFCQECKLLNIGILFAAYSYTDTALIQARKYLSDDKIIATTPSARGDFKGFIDGWWEVNSVDDAVSLFNKFGNPFILGWRNYLSVSQELIDSIVAEMHKRGAFVGTAYLSASQVLKAVKDGLDVIASTNLQVNPSQIGNHLNIRKLNDSSLTFGAGASYDSVSDTIIMTDGAEITLSNSGHENDFMKLSIVLTFNGVLNIQLGLPAGSSTILSGVQGDGSKSIEVAIAVQRKTSLFKLIAQGAVTIKDISVVASVLM